MDNLLNLPPDIKLGLLGRSYHFDRKIPGLTNENNLGLYLEGDKYTGGGYKNSYGDNSLFFARKFKTPIKNLNWFAGAASGYDKDVDNIGGFMPMVGGSYTMGNTRLMITPQLVNFGLVFPLK